jgi:transposase-like protein
MSKRPSTKAGRKRAAKAKKPPAKCNTAPRAREAPEPIEIPTPPKNIDRRSTYDPSFCDRVIELGEEGKSKAQIARALGCSRKSLYLWMKVHPEFGEAMKEAEFAALAWWEDVGQAGLTMPKFNAQAPASLTARPTAS